MLIKENALNIFTDGSSRNSPRTGGIGIRFVIINSNGEEQIKDFEFEGYRNGTNNQMEIHACNMALKEAIKYVFSPYISEIIIYSDSLYVFDNYHKAMFEWPKTRWLTRSGKPVLNANLWKEFLKCVKNIHIPVKVKWVKGHSTCEHNKAVDRLAKSSSKKPFNKPLSHVNVRRKITDKSVSIGSIEMKGQCFSIYIITSEILKFHHLWKYKYEVISRRSIFRRNVDIIFSNHYLGAGHKYYVRVNTDTNNPRIIKVFREIKPKDNNEDNL